MKFLLIAIGLLLPVTAQAKDIMIILNDQEQAAMRHVLDDATKHSGIEIAPITVYLLNKMNTAMSVVGEHKDEEKKPEEKKPEDKAP